MRDLTQADVYKAINIGENTIYRVIKFNRMENRNDFDRMCEYLNVDPYLLMSESYDFTDQDGHVLDTVTSDNIDEFINLFEYRKKDEELFTPTYIHQFFSNVLDPLPFGQPIEKFLFDKIIECRKMFADKYNEYFTQKIYEASLGKKDVFADENEFMNDFNNWFYKTIGSKRGK